MIKYKGKRRLSPLELGLTVTPCRMEYTVVFTEESKYNSNVEPEAIEKLWGLGFGHPHKNSVRVGWNYESDLDRFNLYAYVYIDGERITKHLTYAKAYEKVQVRITVGAELIEYMIKDDNPSETKVKILINVYSTEENYEDRSKSIVSIFKSKHFSGVAYHMNAYTENIPKVEIYSTEPKSKSFNEYMLKLDKYKFPLLALFAIILTQLNTTALWVIAFSIFIPTILYAFYETIKTFFYDRHDIPERVHAGEQSEDAN